MTPSAYPARDCTVITLPSDIAVRAAERLNTEEILAVTDHDCGGFLLFNRWEKCGDCYEVIDRLRCFTLTEEATIADLVLRARGKKAQDVAGEIREADYRHGQQQTTAEWMKWQKRRGSPTRNRRHL